MELTGEESKRILRRIELEAYSALVTALRAQGELDRRKKRLLRELGEQLSISTERHRAEIRRAISDDRLSMIAECVCGSDASVEWESEGRRVVPLMPRLVPQTAFAGSATAAANHAASVNATISSTTKGRVKDDDEDYRSRKRQRTSSQGSVQKVIVSSATKTSTPTTTVRSNNTTMAKDSSRFIKTPTLPVKQDSTQLSSMKMTSSGGVSSKPVVLGGSKSSSVSVAPSKYVAPLPASCLQAHASVVSGNKNRMNLNVVKPKPAKPKFKSLAGSMKMKPASTGSSVGSSVVQTVAQSLLSIAKTKGYEVASSTSKTVQVARSTSTITVAPRSSISLTTFKTTIQPKPTTQSSPVRNVEGISRPTQHGKAVSVSRRTLPPILPKTIPPKALVSSPGRKLAPILPAPAKSTSSSLPNPLIVPVVVSSGSSPIPIAPSPRPPQPYTPGLTSSVMNKVTTVSMVTGQSSDLKRDNQETSIVSSEAKSPVLLGKSPAGSQDSSPMSSKSLDNIHEREALSPVNEILTLVTSPSSVPYVPSSPVKSLPTRTLTCGEISLECDENLLEDFIKDDDIEVRKRTQVSKSIFSPTQDNTESRKDVLTSDLDLIQQTLQDFEQETNLTHVGHSLQELNKSNPETGKEDTSKPIDLSPLVNELISSSPFDVDKKEFEDLDPSNLIQTSTVGDDIVAGNSDLFVGELPVLDLDSDLTLSEIINSDVGDIVSASTAVEKVIEQFSPVDVDTIDGVLQQEMMDLQECTTNLSNKTKQQEFVEMKKDVISQAEDVSSDRKQEVESSPKGLNITEQVNELSSFQDTASSEQNVSLKDKLGDNVVETGENVETLDEQTLLKKSKQGETEFPDFPNNNGNLGSVSQSKNDDVISVSTVDATSGISQDTRNTSDKEPASSESCSSGNTSSENIKTTENKQEPAVSESILGSEVKNRENQVNTVTTGEDETNEMIISSTQEKSNLTEVLDQDATSTTTQAKKSNLTEVLDQGAISTTTQAKKSNLTEVLDQGAISTTTQAEESCQTTGSEEIEVTLGHFNKDDGKQENIDEQLSGSEFVSPDGNLVRTSNRKRKAPPPRDLSVHPPGWVRSALQLLQKVSRFRGSSRSKNARSAASWFLKPVATSEAPGYYKVIKNPMDFGTIKTKLEASEYSAPAHFHRDMLLVKSNCSKYNPPGHVVRKDCDEVFQFYEAEYERFVEKLDKIYLSAPKKQKTSPV
ncbi:BRCA2-interacting transcriptional repressor EMSY-like isoform X1 [Paramuricea clavata]|uniref:BRCA2-interacting transcriptional repressor EMSY-like isoform X1 n=1 Tax=Paramuricea clavata TaxID=317549 RepID=A0A7D9HYQ3_PARCT|nr:BRCA2-interacting transcriptional repressor EMSY-like isoform X1 [Paramuricea clavata]